MRIQNSDFTILSDDEIVKKALSAANGSAFKALWEGSTVLSGRAATPCKWTACSDSPA